MVSKGLFISIFLSSLQVFGWGANGHEIVAAVGASNARGGGREFWLANSESVRQLSTVPDRLWKRPNTKAAEAPHHWFQVDVYAPNLTVDEILALPRAYQDAVGKFGQDSVTKNGTAPWRIQQFYSMAVAAIRNQDLRSAVQYIGVMSHYIGDLSQPLHVSENYDGGQTGNAGIHAFFETKNIADPESVQTEVQKRTEALLADADFAAQFKGEISDIIFNEIARSVQLRDTIINNDLKLGRTSANAKKTQLDIAEDRMADGAATLAMILDKLWTETGVDLKASPVPVDDPDYIADNFSSASVTAEEADCLAR